MSEQREQPEPRHWCGMPDCPLPAAHRVRLPDDGLYAVCELHYVPLRASRSTTGARVTEADALRAALKSADEATVAGVREVMTVRAERDQLAETNRGLAVLCETYAAEVAPLRKRVALLEGLLQWIDDEAALYSVDGRAETMRRLRDALAGTDTNPKEVEG